MGKLRKRGILHGYGTIWDYSSLRVRSELLRDAGYEEKQIYTLFNKLWKDLNYREKETIVNTIVKSGQFKEWGVPSSPEKSGSGMDVNPKTIGQETWESLSSESREEILIEQQFSPNMARIHSTQPFSMLPKSVKEFWETLYEP